MSAGGIPACGPRTNVKGAKDKGSGAHAQNKGGPGSGAGSGPGYGSGLGQGQGQGFGKGPAPGFGPGSGSGSGSGLAAGQGLEDQWLPVDVPCHRGVGVTPVVWSGKDKSKGAPKGTFTSSSSSSSFASTPYSSGLHYQVHIRVSGKVFELGVFRSEEEASTHPIDTS